MNIQTHILNTFPEEMCGIIVEGDFIPLQNIAENKEETFKIDTKELIPFLGKIEFIVHSHCQNENTPLHFDIRTPSLNDVKGQKLSGVPWLIYGTEGETVTEPLKLPRTPSRDYEGRPLIWYISDCYNLVQDYYRYELNIILKDHDIKQEAKDLVNAARNLEKNGLNLEFTLIPETLDFRNGDVLVLNNSIPGVHLGVYHEGYIIHQDDISIKHPLAYFIGRILGTFRYAGTSSTKS